MHSFPVLSIKHRKRYQTLKKKKFGQLSSFLKIQVEISSKFRRHSVLRSAFVCDKSSFLPVFLSVTHHNSSEYTLHEATMGKDYYALLGLTKDATQDQIKQAYKKLALKWHPDRNADKKEAAEAKFKEVRLYALNSSLCHVMEALSDHFLLRSFSFPFLGTCKLCNNLA